MYRRLTCTGYCIVIPALLSACASAPVPSNPDVAPNANEQAPLPVQPSIETNKVPNGHGQLSNGIQVAENVPDDYQAPTQLPLIYEDAARYAQSPERENLLLTAADAWARSGNVGQAAQILVGLRRTQLSPTQTQRLDLVRARIDQGKRRHQLAATRLETLLVVQPLPIGVASELLRMLALSNVALGDRMNAARYLVTRQELMRTERDSAVNRQSLLKLLSTIDEMKLQLAAADRSDITTAGWVEYALMQQRYRVPLQAPGSKIDIPPADLDAWSARFPNHPANGNGLMVGTTDGFQPFGGSTNMVADYQQVRQIGVLLPLTSNFASAAQTVYDGIAAMHDADSRADKPQLVLYDTGAEADLAAVYYRLAVREGADFIIGPLGRQAVQSLVTEEEFVAPTLLLGKANVSGNTLHNVFQFGLIPEDEATQIANDAFADGHRVAVTLFPENQWGQKLNTAFTERFIALGGEVVRSKAYASDFSSYPEIIKSMLSIDQSESRHSQITAMIGVRPKFQSRRRQDIDFCFSGGTQQVSTPVKTANQFLSGP